MSTEPAAIPQGFGVQGPIKVTTQQLQQKSPTIQYLKRYQLLDANLRVRQEQQPSPVSGQTILTDTTYNSRGLVQRQTQSQSLVATPGAGIIPIPSPVNHHVFTYDELKRTRLDEYFATGTEQYETETLYGHGTVETNPPIGGNTKTVTDALDQSWKTQEYHTESGQWDTATYVHDAAGQLKSITDPALNEITYDYNMLGHRIGMVDPDAGNWSYTYDAVGNQTLSTDAKPNGTIFTVYDRLNRPIARHGGADANGPLRAEWEYDTIKKGLLTKTIRHQTPGTNAENYTTEVTGYDARNRPTGRKWSFPSALGLGVTDYTVNYTKYDFADHRLKTEYPAVGGLPAETVTAAYSNLGQPATLNGNIADSAYVASTFWGSRGRVTVRFLGTDTATTDAVRRSYGYDTHQRLTNWTARANTDTGTLLQNDTISLNHTGDVTERLDALTTTRECYDYDSRHRLTAADTTTGTCATGTPNTGSAPYQHSYTYAADGKITSRNEGAGTLTYTYGGSKPHAVTDITGATADCDPTANVDNYCYDANGNMTGRPGTTGLAQAFIWDRERNLREIDDNGAAAGGKTTFVYDPDGARLVRTTPTSTTLYIEGQEVTLSGAAVNARRHYTLGGATAAVRTSAGAGSLDYLLGDQLGSTSVTVKAAGGAPVVQRYLPFGAPRSTTGGSAATDRGWIGQTNDGSTGLQFLNARYYDSTIGRFAGVDRLADMSQPESLDGYGYGLGSPVTLSDPTGLRVPVGIGSDPDSGGSVGLLLVRLTSLTPGAPGREGCSDAEEVPSRVQAGCRQGGSSG